MSLREKEKEFLILRKPPSTTPTPSPLHEPPSRPPTLLLSGRAGIESAQSLLATQPCSAAAAWPWLETSHYTREQPLPQRSAAAASTPPFITLCVILLSSGEGTQKWGAGKVSASAGAPPPASGSDLTPGQQHHIRSGARGEERGWCWGVGRVEGAFVLSRRKGTFIFICCCQKWFLSSS